MTLTKAIGSTIALLLLLGSSAWAAIDGEGDLVATFDGSMSPSTLRRAAPSPVAVRVAGGVRSASGNAGALPQLRRISIAINRQGRFFDGGLPVCLAREIRSSTTAGARAACGEALVGQGHVTVQVRIPEQLPFLSPGRLLAFNGPHRNGQKLIVALVNTSNPPGAFVLTFHIRKQAGTFGTVVSMTLPRQLRRWAYLTHFEMTLHRIYTYKGRRRSYVSAACGAPAGFDTAFFPFARANFGFASGQRLSMSVTKSCHVAG